MTKKLYRSRHDAKVCGICGGIGEYLNIDPTLIRLLAVVAIFMMTIVPGLVVYFIIALIIPREPEFTPHSHDYHDHEHHN